MARGSRHVQLPSDPSGAGQARRIVTDCAVALGMESCIDVATLLVSELVANAVRHGQPPFGLSCEPADSGLRISVTDHSTRPPAGHAPAPTDEGGRGLFLIAALARRWGTTPTGDGGKSVWFELAPQRN